MNPQRDDFRRLDLGALDPGQDAAAFDRTVVRILDDVDLAWSDGAPAGATFRRGGIASIGDRARWGTLAAAMVASAAALGGVLLDRTPFEAPAALRSRSPVITPYQRLSDSLMAWAIAGRSPRSAQLLALLDQSPTSTSPYLFHLTP